MTHPQNAAGAARPASKLLQSRGVDPHELWTNHVRRRLEHGFDPKLACLGLILDCVLAANWRVLDERALMWVQ